MSDRFQPIQSDQLISWVFEELETNDSIFGIPRQLFFVPSPQDPFRTTAFGQTLETPFGPAAGPHSQMAQNIVAAWLCGARYIELKTVQTIDELHVSKPCIDMQDEGYNVEWSQELKIHQSYEEYLRAWVLIHALHGYLGFPGDSPGMLFNLSVGYDLDGIRKPNMQWFLDRVRDGSADRKRLIGQIEPFYPAVADLRIPDCLSDSVTLSTMHGCPPDEIGSICDYLMRERGLHTFVKCNPTLLGPERVRHLLGDVLGFKDAVVPDQAFEHDLKYSEAVPLLTGLQSTASELGLDFGVKLTNTLEVLNFRTVFNPGEAMMYLSGRPLHAITVRLAQVLNRAFDDAVPMSFSAGADCFNAPDLLAAGMQTVTVCSDLLKTGGYLRLLQYLELTRDACRLAGASNLGEFIRVSAGSDPHAGDVDGCTRQNLGRYAERCEQEPRLKKRSFDTARSKTRRNLHLFDCIEAPCQDQCPVDQNVPCYMRAVRRGDFAGALRITRADNPISAILGRVCDHLCEPVCVRTHLDEPLAIRHIKRFVLEHEKWPEPRPDGPSTGKRIAIIGAGPGGIAAAIELARGGCQVEIYEEHAYPGGMVGGAIPRYRLPQAVIDQDLAELESLGVQIHYRQKAGRDFYLSTLRESGFEFIVLMVGAQRGKKLGLEGEDCDGVIDALDYLRACREGRPPEIGHNIGVIGAGDTAMDCARTAWRQSSGNVSVIYRRSIDQMPADREEVKSLLEEGIKVFEMARPGALRVEQGKLRALSCRRTQFNGGRDESGRKIPRDLPDSDPEAAFDLPLDTLILAISQHAVLDFFEREPIRLNSRGYIEADPATFETSVAGVYAGGDVVNEGPSSIVEAAADGKAIAASILNQQAEPDAPVVEAFDPADLLRRRSHREWRVPIPQAPVTDRKSFEEVVRPYDSGQAIEEAARCLDCDRYCSLCVSVCPNLALQTFRSAPLNVDLAKLHFDGRRIRMGQALPFRVRQAFQIVLLADWCNECGNCTTFCPTSGEPYRDKPRLYLDRAEFEAQRDNAFRILHDYGQWSIEARFAAATHRLELGRWLEYSGPAFTAQIDPADFAVRRIEPAAGCDAQAPLPLEPAATMYLLLKGLVQSMPHLPVAGPHSGRAAPAGYPQ